MRSMSMVCNMESITKTNFILSKRIKRCSKSLLICIVVILDVIAELLLSIIFKNLLYLNLAPNLLISVDDAYRQCFDTIEVI